LAVLLGGVRQGPQPDIMAMSCSAAQAAPILSYRPSRSGMGTAEKRGGARGRRRAPPSSSQEASGTAKMVADGGLQRHRAYVDEHLVGLLYVCLTPIAERKRAHPAGPVCAKRRKVRSPVVMTMRPDVGDCRFVVCGWWASLGAGADSRRAHHCVEFSYYFWIFFGVAQRHRTRCAAVADACSAAGLMFGLDGRG